MLGILKHGNCRLQILLPAIFYFVHLGCYEYSNQEIKELAQSEFADTLGFKSVIDSNNIGRFFEMEAALCLSSVLPDQGIKGFSLEINVFESNDKQRFGEEFDLVTDDYIVECKTCGWPDHHCSEFCRSKNLDQFIKQKEFLDWVYWLNKKIKRGKASFEYFISKRNKPFFKFIVNRKKHNKNEDFLLACSWVTGRSSEECLEQLLHALRCLMDKSLIVFFKSNVCSECCNYLSANNIDYLDGIFLDCAKKRRRI